MAAAPGRGRPGDAVPALRAGARTLHLLSRVPASPWRNSCLFRSVTECLVLRGHGVDARLRIGVRGATGAGEAVEHHAWVWRSDVDTAYGAAVQGYQPLSNPAWLSAPPAPTSHPLVEDGAVEALIDPALLPAMEGWLPLAPEAPRAPGPGARARLHLREASSAPPSRPASAPHFTYGSAAGWVDGGGDLRLHGSGSAFALVELSRASAEVSAPDPRTGEDPGRDERELHDVGTVAAALLLGCVGRVLAHSAAVVAPDGRAWLIPGDTRAGKSTTCANLVGSGWGYLADDHVVLQREPGGGGVWVEGWTRPFNLDVGWAEGVPRGTREPVDPVSRWPGLWRRAAPLGGFIFPRVEGGALTELSPLRPAETLGRLIRAMPWLMLDRARAPALLELLRAAASLPAATLRLGKDVLRDGDRLVALLDTVTGASTVRTGK